MGIPVLLAQSPILQFFDNQGHPAVGGSVLTQVGGLNYPTYQDSAGTIPLLNPIPLNARGEISTAAGASAQLFLASGVVYTFTLFDADGNQLNQATYVTNGAPTNFNVGTGSYVNNVTSLLAITTPFPAFVEMLGYTTPGDGGGSEFYYDPTSTATVDNGSVFKPTSVGGAGRYILKPKPSLFAAQFGIVNDSTATINGTDNAVQINRLIAYLANNPGLRCVWPTDITKTVGFTGILQFSHAKDIVHVFDSPLRNIGNWNVGGPTILFGSSIFINHLAGNNTEISRQYGYPIATIAAGNDTPALLTAGNNVNFKVGGWVAVLGYDQQGNGFPPNYRYVDFRRVKSISGANIQLDKDIDNSYYSTWYYYTDGIGTVGPANLLPIDRGVNCQFIERLEVYNLTVQDNPAESPVQTVDGEATYNSSLVGIFGCKSAKIVNLKASGLFTGESESIILDDAEIIDFEPDKIQKNLILNRGRYTRIIQATGIESLEANETIFKFQTGIVSRKYRAKLCHYLNNHTPSGINAPLAINIGLYQQEQIYQNCIFDWDQNVSIILGIPPAETGGIPYWPGILSLTVSADIAPSSSSFTANFNTGSSGGAGRIRLELGMGTILIRASDGARFKVSQIEYSGAGGSDASGYFIISINSAYTPVIGDVLYYYPMRIMSIQGTTNFSRYRIPFLGGGNNGKRFSDIYLNNIDGYNGRAIEPVFRDIPSTAISSNGLYELDSFVEEITIFVDRPYGGAGDNRMQIRAYTPTGSSWANTIINTAITGQRIIKVASSVNNNGGSAPSGEVLQDLGYERFIGLLSISVLASDNPGPAGWDGSIHVRGVRRN